MTHEHQCICATCFKEIRPGRNSSHESSPSTFPQGRHVSTESAYDGPAGVPRGWADWLLEWAKIALKFGYLILAFFKL